MSKIAPKNLSAQLNHRAAGNPPSTVASSAVGNYYPGLELDFRNTWRRIFVGIELHEAMGMVVRVDDDAPPAIKALHKEVLISVDGKPVWTEVRGPKRVGGPVQMLDAWYLEWSNALADLAGRGGTKVPCLFTRGDAATTTVDLQVRHVFERVVIDGVVTDLAVINHELAGPGELTQSLCSPWQNDFIGCACYYWAANRPDYINVEPDGDGGSRGQNWLEKHRKRDDLFYTLEDDRLLKHEDIIKSWEVKLRFVIAGRDER
jgi:hypothetical protein